MTHTAPVDCGWQRWRDLGVLAHDYLEDGDGVGRGACEWAGDVRRGKRPGEPPADEPPPPAGRARLHPVRFAGGGDRGTLGGVLPRPAEGQAGRNLPRPDISPWILAFLDAVAAQQREVRDALHGLPREGRLSGNQLAVLAIAARDGEVTNRRAASELSLPRETAKQTLGRRVALGALRRLGAGRATRYRLP